MSAFLATVAIAVRRSQAEDAPTLAVLHAEAWRSACRGIIPGLALEQMIARRGARWWGRAHVVGAATAVLEFDGRLARYVTYGRCGSGRMGARGEIYELYLKAEYHGAGLGRLLFRAARNELREQGLPGLVVRSLVANDGQPVFTGRWAVAPSPGRVAGLKLATIAFHWR